MRAEEGEGVRSRVREEEAEELRRVSDDGDTGEGTYEDRHRRELGEEVGAGEGERLGKEGSEKFREEREKTYRHHHELVEEEEAGAGAEEVHLNCEADRKSVV